MGNSDFQILKTEGRARRGVFTTPHGVIQSPFFMNVGTAGAIKGGISSVDLKGLKRARKKHHLKNIFKCLF